MLSDNIRNYRKSNNMSQDELAEKLGVSRQSVSLWETGQTQPTIDNIIALAKIFNISTGVILDDADNAETSQEKNPNEKKKNKTRSLIAIVIAAAAVIAGAVLLFVFLGGNSDNDIPGNIVHDKTTPGNTAPDDTTHVDATPDNTAFDDTTHVNTIPANTAPDNSTPVNTVPDNSAPVNTTPVNTAPENSTPVNITPVNTVSDNSVPENTTPDNTVPDNSTPENTTPVNTAPDNIVPDNTVSPPVTQQPQEPEKIDIFSCCKDFAIQKGNLNGDYCIYQQPSTLYGGYENEYFSISYWGNSDMVEICLHCPLDETLSINFYLRMRGGYNNKYEYLSSRYFRDTGESLRSASGYIDPSVFSDKYPLSCDSYDSYEDSIDGQNDFMEESRVGICDLIYCLKNFVEVEDIGCTFSDFEFVNF